MVKTKKSSRKGPSESATKFKVGTKRRGNDGKMWEIIETGKGVKRWKRITTSTSSSSKATDKMTKKNVKSIKGKTYYTHWNGSRPIMVIVNKSNIHVYKLPDDIGYKNNYTKNDYTKTITSFESVQKVYIGNSMKGDNAGGDTKFGRGNSILVHLSGKKYAFIGAGVLTFELEADDEFQNFYSPIGRNDVPYPILLGKKNVYFLMNNGGFYYLPRDLEEFHNFPSNHSWAMDAYSVYYGNHSFDEKLSMKKMKKKYKKIKNQKIIQSNIY